MVDDFHFEARTIWNDEIIPALGLGCWAIGGPFWSGEQPLGWGEVDDATSIRAIHAALEAGIRFFDTSDAYGTGRSERVLGRALAGRSEDVIVATKFGNTYDTKNRQLKGIDVSPAYVRWALGQSLDRLGRDRVSLYQLHVDSPGPAADETLECLRELRDEGLIDAFGWSTDTVAEARRWIGEPGYVSVQHALNLFQPAPEMLALCQDGKLLSINRSPLAMGLLTAKFDGETRLGPDDIRSMAPDWLPFFSEGRPKPEFAARLAAVRELLTSDGRTLVQGAIAWIWGQSPQTIPIPGFRTPEQVMENVGALEKGALPTALLREIETLMRADRPT